MTTSQSRNLRKAGAVALSLALAMSTLAITPASAAKKVKLAKTKISVNVGKTKTVKIKNVKKKQVKKLTVKSSKAAVAKAKASKKTAIKVTGKKKGSAKVTANLKLKKKVGGKKAYKLTLKVTVKNAAPAPAPTVTPVPTAAPVISGESVTLDATSYTCEVSGSAVKMTAKIVPETSNDTPTWSFEDPTKATVSGAGAAVNGIATAELVGLAAGETRVSCKLPNGASATAKVIVKGETIAVKVIKAVQSKADEITVTFDRDATKDNVAFKKADGTYDKTLINVEQLNTAGKGIKDISVTKIAMAQDGMTAKFTLNSTLIDKTKYNVYLYKNHKDAAKYKSVADFTAAIGEPASIQVVTTQAELKVPTTIEVALFDAAAMDVTAAYPITSKVSFSYGGDKTKYTTDSADPSKPKITMNELGAKAEVTVSYKKNVSDTKAAFSGMGVIECVEAKPVYGTAHFAKTGTKKLYTDDKTGTAKFYLADKDITSLEIQQNSDPVEVSFYAADEDGNAISYDSYKVESANKNVASAVAADTKEGGKYFNFKVSALAADGGCNINVTAIAHGQPANYLIPITCAPKRTFTSLTITPNRTSVSNAFSDEYQNENKIKYEALDEKGNKLTLDNVVYEITSPTAPKGRSITYTIDSSNKEVVDVDKKFTLKPNSDYTCGFDAAGAYATTYRVKATGYLGDQKQEAQTEIVVKNVPDAYFSSGNGGVVTYGLVVDPDKIMSTANTKTLKLEDATEKTAAVRIAAYAGSDTSAAFLGYVDASTANAGYIKNNIPANVTTDSANFVSGTTTATNQLKIKASANGGFITGGAQAGDINGALAGAADISVQVGGKWATNSAVGGAIPLYDRSKNATGVSFATGTAVPFTGAVISAFNTGNASTVKYYSDENWDPDFAKKGTYNVEVHMYFVNDKGKATMATLKGSVVVENAINIPTVDYDTKTVQSIEKDKIIEALRTNVDLNCNEANNDSIKNLYIVKNNATVEPEYTGNTLSISYVGIEEVSGLQVVIPATLGFDAAS